MPRQINLGQEVSEMIDIHVFADESLLGTCAVAYAVTRQLSGAKEGLITTKSRLSKRQLTIPRLELVATLMVANLADNVQNSLPNYNIREVYLWSYSTVEGSESNKQFVHDRVEVTSSLFITECEIYQLRDAYNW